MSAQPKLATPQITPTEYLRRERAAEFRSQYVDGHVYAMAGASKEHNRLVLALATHLYNQLRGKPCEPFVTEMRVRTPGDSLYTYPDVIVACNPEFLDNEFDTVTNPVVIFEVLSPSTADFDSRPKFNRYRQIPTLREYVLISQERMSVEHRSRSLQTEEDHWWVRVLETPEEELVLDSINCRIKLEDLYERVTFNT